MPAYIDFHCDTLMMFARGAEPSALYEAPAGDSFRRHEQMLDITRLKKADCKAQFFATFMPPSAHMPEGMSDEDYRTSLYKGLMACIRQHPDEIAFSRSYSDYLANKADGRISAFLTFEDGRMIDGSFEKLRMYYDQGYRLISLTWNYANCFGYPNSRDPQAMALGLTDFGREAVPYMNDLGILVDVSHLSDGGFYDVAAVARKPFVASHSCARALTPHPRNLTDDMLKVLGSKGGFVGINFAPEFVGETTDCKQSTVRRICDHIMHIANKAGTEAIGIGTDFDGIGGELEVGQPTDLYLLFDELSKRGWSQDQLDRFGVGNAERILRETL